MIGVSLASAVARRNPSRDSRVKQADEDQTGNKFIEAVFPSLLRYYGRPISEFYISISLRRAATRYSFYPRKCTTRVFRIARARALPDHFRSAVSSRSSLPFVNLHSGQDNRITIIVISEVEFSQPGSRSAGVGGKPTAARRTAISPGLTAKLCDLPSRLYP